MNDSIVVEEGTHEQLLKQTGGVRSDLDAFKRRLSSDILSGFGMLR